ncbi:MAG TPA: 6-bladed beta-propeller, partial [Longimicrobiaceae bacterium]
MRSAILFRAAVAGALLVAPAAHSQQKSMLPERDRPLALRTTPVYTVGVEDGRESEMFSNVDQVAFDAQDNLYVLDRGNNRVQVFDRTGRFVRQVGKKGGGPGEFQAPLGLAVTTDGTLVVADLGHRSYSLFGRDGRYQRSVPFGDEWMPMLGGVGMAPHPRGGIVTAARAAPDLQPARAGTVEEKQTTPILWEPLRAGTRASRLYAVVEEVTVRTSNSPAGGRERRSFMVTGPAAFTPRLNWSVLPSGGLVVANTAGYTVKVVGTDGKIARYIQKPMRERKVT